MSVVPTCPLLDVVGHDLHVPLVDGRTVRQVNLDHAASTPALRAVADHVAEVLPLYASVHRGAGYTSQVSTALYEQARHEIGAFVGARDDDVVVVVRNTTDALNLLAACVPDGRRVVHLDVEHHANLLPWRRRDSVVVPAAPTVAATLRALEVAFRAHRPALLTLTGASNVTGETLPIERVVALAHAHGVRVAVDGAQLVPHRAVDLATSGADYLALSGHKLYAPFGAGVLVGRRDWLDDAPPYLAGGGAVREVALDAVAWAPAPQRHEGGSPNVVGAAALAAACRTLAGVAPEQRAAHEQALRAELVELLARRSLPVLRIWEDAPDDAGVGVVSVRVPGHDPGLVAARLSAEHGISVRDGRFCAHPLLQRVGAPEGAVRVSVGVGSGSEDLDRLGEALDAVLADRAGADAYVRRDGRWTPADDRRPAPVWLSRPLGEAPAPCADEPAATPLAAVS